VRIQIVLSGVTKHLDIDENATIDELKAQVAALFSAEIGEAEVYGIVRHKSGKAVANGTLKTNGIAPYDTLEAKVRQAGGKNVYTPTVKQVLVTDLQSLATVKQPMLVFLTIASCDQGHGEASIRRQQCPPMLQKICATYGLTLRVLLIDKGFSTTQNAQIYDIEPWAKVSDDADGLMKRYTHDTRKIDQVWVYGTHTDSTDYELSQSQPKDWDNAFKQCSLAGVDISQLGQTIMQNGGVLILGNFYSEDATPIYAAGNAKALQDLRSALRW
jgi:hypothetical protein